MNEQKLIWNTLLILNDLKSYTTDYLNLLSVQQQDDFVKEWLALSSEVTLLSQEDAVKKVNEIIFKYPALIKEFLGELKIEEIRGMRFDPNAVSVTPSPDVKPPVDIPNEVITIGKKLEEINKGKKLS